MKNLNSIIITILFITISHFVNSQNDTIYTQTKKVIPCKILSINEKSITFKDKEGYNDDILLNQVDKYFKSGKLIPLNFPIDTTINGLFIDNVNINSLDIKYCSLAGFDLGLFRSNIIIFVDYGQFLSNPQDVSIKNSKGKIMKFNSMIEALNFMEKNGWEYVSQSVNTGLTSLFGKNGALYKYLLKRKTI